MVQRTTPTLYLESIIHTANKIRRHIEDDPDIEVDNALFDELDTADEALGDILDALEE